MTVSRSDDWFSAKMGEETVMMSVSQGNYIGLSRVGSRIWELLEQPRTIDGICDILEVEFEVARETCRAEVTDFLMGLAAQDAVRIDPAPSR